jgi:tryptophanase
LDFNVINQTPLFVDALAKELQAKNVPIVTPAGGLGCHVNAMKFCDHIPQEEYPAGALTTAIYIASGVRSMERGTLSEERNPDGSEHLSEMELARLAIPKRVFTLSHIKYTADRIGWLYENRKLIGGLEFTEEPAMLRFFIGKLKPKTPWVEELAKKFRADFGTSL